MSDSLSVDSVTPFFPWVWCSVDSYIWSWNLTATFFFYNVGYLSIRWKPYNSPTSLCFHDHRSGRKNSKSCLGLGMPKQFWKVSFEFEFKACWRGSVRSYSTSEYWATFVIEHLLYVLLEVKKNVTQPSEGFL